MASLLLSIPSIVIACIIVAVVILTIILLVFLSRIKKCPSDKIMVIFGYGIKDKYGRLSFKCIHGGCAFVMPLFQSYSFLDLNPIPITIDLRNSFSNKDIHIDALAKFTVAISTEENIMQNAVERLLGLQQYEIQDIAEDLILGQIGLVIDTMENEEIEKNRDRFFEATLKKAEEILNRIGLKIVNAKLLDVVEP